MLSALFEQFVREKRLLKNVTPKTVRCHNQSWGAFTGLAGRGILWLAANLDSPSMALY
jgi:hypothetical protein